MIISNEVTPFDDAWTALEKLSGNLTVDSVEAALATLNNWKRGDFVVGLYDNGAPAHVLRAAVESCWNHDHGKLWNACETDITKFRKLFRAAKFDKSHLPVKLNIWRGGVVPPDNHWGELGLGVSWTLNRDCACWFAPRTATKTCPYSRVFPLIPCQNLTSKGPPFLLSFPHGHP